MLKNLLNKKKKYNSDIIEVHNRPIYVKYLLFQKISTKLVLYFHNDPLSMSGSKSIEERKYLLKNCEKIIFNSHWSKKRFLQSISHSVVNFEKIISNLSVCSKIKN